MLVSGDCAEYQIGYILVLKPVQFLGDSLKRIRAFPDDVRRDLGHQIDKLQRGGSPSDFKPMPSVGAGVEEIRIRDKSGAYRVIYSARRPEVIYVLHAFQKKTARTAPMDIQLARRRFAMLLQGG